MVTTLNRRVRLTYRRQIVRGLASLLDLSGPPRAYRPTEPMDSLRGDMEKIGADMHLVVLRETANEKASRKAAEPAE